MKKIFTLTAIACLVISIQSCKKDKDSNPTPNPPTKQCRLTAATSSPSSGSGTTYSFTYNNDNKVSQIVTSGSPVYTKTFTYNGHTINIISKSGTTVNGKTVITTNDAGRQLHSEERDVNTDTITSYSDFEYTNNGDLLKITQKYGSSPSTIINLTYSNGNLMSLSSSGSVTTYDYYTDQSFRIGDAFYFSQIFEFGTAFYIVNKNLVKSYSRGSIIENYNYTFDTDNNITQMKTINGSNISTIAVQQLCE